MRTGAKVAIGVLSGFAIWMLASVSIVVLGIKLFVDDVVSARFPETNFSSYTKWTSENGLTTMYCMNSKYGGYGYTTINDQEEFFSWSKCANKTCYNADLIFYFPSYDKAVELTESIKDSNANTAFLKPDSSKSIISSNWSSVFYKQDLSIDEIDMRYCFFTKISNADINLKFNNVFLYDKALNGSKTYSNYGERSLDVSFENKFSMVLSLNELTAKGVWTFTKENYYLKLEKDEIFGKEGETLIFNVDIEY